MRVTVFTHSLVSCWNHGNAHFLRGVLRALQALGHETRVWEPADGWSRDNLLRDHGEAGLAPFANAYPDLTSRTYDATLDVNAMLDGADLVLVHEWSDPALVAALGRARARGGRFRLLFHDTHHRAVSDPAAMRAFDLSGYDGVLAFGAALADVYRDWGWGDRVFVWHEAADTTLFRPPPVDGPRDGLVWIGNWGDGERTAELDEYLLRPAARGGVTLDIHGVRYPDEALAMLARAGARYRGWIANPLVPGVFARHRATVHVPRGYYAGALPGIPTIRVFEALACGIPLLSAPWSDTEGLFRVGTDFLMPRSGEAMERAVRGVMHDDDLAASLARSGLATIRARHTCDHRARELLTIAARLDGAVERKVA
jgi:spore maturation protein CgeB